MKSTKKYQEPSVMALDVEISDRVLLDSSFVNMDSGYTDEAEGVERLID